MSSYITRRAQAELLKLAFSTFIDSIIDTLPPTVRLFSFFLLLLSLIIL
jgi:hypothetical protein